MLMHCIYSHILLVFGGLQEAVEADEDLKVSGEDAAELFDLFIDPGQHTGVRSVRVEVRMHDCHTNQTIPDLCFTQGICFHGDVCVWTIH